jgi:hypothetical protein
LKIGLTGQQSRALFFAWLPAAIGVLTIASESSDYLSSAHTGSLLQHLCSWLGCCRDWNFALVNHILRKTGHFAGYGMLCLLFYRAWRLTGYILSSSRTRVIDTVFSLLCTLVISSADEYHQSFLPSRTGRPQDVLLDMAGAAIFLLAFHLWLRSSRQEPVMAG